MATLDLETWIDSVHTELNARMGNRYPAAAEVVSIAYSHQKSAARAIAVPRVEWGEVPKYSAALEINRPLKGGDDGIGICRMSVPVAIVAATLDDCRALLANLLQAMLQKIKPTAIAWPIRGTQAARDVSHDGRLSKKIELTIGIDLTIPSDPQDLGDWDPTAPSIEQTPLEFQTIVDTDEDTPAEYDYFTQP